METVVIICDINKELQVGLIIPSEHVMDYFARSYPPGVRGQIIRKASKEEWLKGHREEGINPNWIPDDDLEFFEISFD
jgi:hypothetical protein